MRRTPSIPVALALAAAALTWPWSPGVRPAAAQGDASPAPGEIADLRREIQELRDQLEALRRQIALLGPAAAEGANARPSPAMQAAPPPAPPSQTAGRPQAAPEPPALPPVVAQSRRQNLLNPAISALFLATGNTSLRRQSDDNGFDLSEAEFAFQAAVDPFTKVDLFLAFPAGETPEVEEGFITTLALPGPLQLKGGRFKSAFGKWNTLHNHQFFTVERPNVLENFFGEESLATDGLSLSVLIPNPWDLYIDSLSEVGTALEGVGFNGQRRNLTYLEHLSAFFNPTVSGTLEIGLTAAFGKTGASEALIQAIEDASLTGTVTPRDELDSRVEGIDVTYKWRPPQRNVYRSFLWQTELLRSRRDVEVLAGTTLVPDVVSSLGAYSYLEAQFTKRWRFGARYDLSDFPDSEEDRERALSAVVRFLPSEFQELRFQIKRTTRNDAAALRFGGEEEDTRLFFEWIPVIGAHGAHKF